MIVVPLAASLFTAIAGSEPSRTASPVLEFPHLNSGLREYGTLKTNGLSSCERNGGTAEENSRCNVRYTLLLI